jgi:3-oxoacyl-(acyl-carrier-protein) synthase
MQKKSIDSIAVIGMSVKIPLANTLEEYWEIIRQGKSVLRSFPKNRENDIKNYFDTIPYTYEVGGYLEYIDEFDYQFFGLTPREAQLMDPAHRIFLQTAWDCLENGGYGEDRIRGSRTGVYVGCGENTSYFELIKKLSPEFISLSATGNCMPMISGRLAHMLDLKGPNMVINTVCSSSLTAVHMAVKAIQNRECEMALAGGIQLHILPIREVNINLQAQDGRIKSFDDSADGTGSGEGVGVVLLKPLESALADRDYIYAVIKGSCINHDGGSIGLTAPNPDAQKDAMVSAWEQAGIDPVTISYIEAHASGTVLGDTVEMQGIKKAFELYSDRLQFCPIGCIKPNIGHLDAASGIAGFIKSVLCLQHKSLPPMVNFNCPSRYIEFLKLPVYINRKLKYWESNGVKRRCGVNSFGFSGSNCHILLEEYETGVKKVNTEKPYIFTISAKAEDSLNHYIVKYIAFLTNNKNISIDNLCYTSNIGRNHYKFRLAFPVVSVDDLMEQLTNFLLNNKSNKKEQMKFNTSEKTKNEEPAFVLERYISALRKDKYTYAVLLCNLYRKGANIDWKQIYCGNNKYQTICLPGYPFKRYHCWVEKQKKGIIKSDNNRTVDTVAGIIKNIMGLSSLPEGCNFFDIGGNSIIAMQIINRINSELALSLKVTELLQNSTIDSFCSYVLEKNSEIKGNNDLVLKRTEKASCYPLTHSQKRLFSIDKLYAKNIAYNMYSVIKMYGPVNHEKIRQVFKQLIERHESLRTSFTIFENRPVSIIDEVGIINYSYVKSKEKLQNLLDKFIKPFDLEAGSLLRILLVERSKKEFDMIIDMHHIISDGISMNLLIDEFCKLYQDIPLEPVTLDYRDYAKWENNYILTDNYKQQRCYWIDKFKPLKLEQKNEITSIEFSGHTIFHTIKKNKTKQIIQYAKERNMTLFSVLFSACVLLQYYQSGDNYILTGTVVSGRNQENLQNIVGFFAKTIAILTEINIDCSIKVFIESVKENIYNAFDNQEYPFEALAQEIYGNISYVKNNPFFQLMFIMQDNVRAELFIEDIKLEFKQPAISTSKFDMLFNLYECNGVLKLEINYNSYKYRQEEILRYIELYQKILFKLISYPELNIIQLFNEIKE